MPTDIGGNGSRFGVSGAAGGTYPKAVARPDGALPDSVPTENSPKLASGGTTLRTMRGVISSTISLLSCVSFLLANKRPMIGKLERPGIHA